VFAASIIKVIAPDDSHLHTRRRENLKSHLVKFLS
jgi:hypothetical protein